MGLGACKGIWKALGMLFPERLRALRHVINVEEIGFSTSTQNRKLSDREIE